jgi:hypothetical protein
MRAFISLYSAPSDEGIDLLPGHRLGAPSQCPGKSSNVRGTSTVSQVIE